MQKKEEGRGERKYDVIVIQEGCKMVVEERRE
jgi:hypothetical protein